MLMVCCEGCSQPKTYSPEMELYLLKASFVICGNCGWNNKVTEDLKDDIRRDWNIK